MRFKKVITNLIKVNKINVSYTFYACNLKNINIVKKNVCLGYYMIYSFKKCV